jgi:hypothetical protein
LLCFYRIRLRNILDSTLEVALQAQGLL